MPKNAGDILVLSYPLWKQKNRKVNPQTVIKIYRKKKS